MLHELLFPRTDGGIAIQLATVVAVTLVAFAGVRRDPELRLFVVGVFVMTMALFGLRMLH